MAKKQYRRCISLRATTYAHLRDELSQPLGVSMSDFAEAAIAHYAAHLKLSPPPAKNGAQPVPRARIEASAATVRAPAGAIPLRRPVECAPPGGPSHTVARGRDTSAPTPIASARRAEPAVCPCCGSRSLRPNIRCRDCAIGCVLADGEWKRTEMCPITRLAAARAERPAPSSPPAPRATTATAPARVTSPTPPASARPAGGDTRMF